MPENTAAAFPINPNIDSLMHCFMIHYLLHNRLHISLIGPDTNIITTNKTDKRIKEETLYLNKMLRLYLTFIKHCFNFEINLNSKGGVAYERIEERVKCSDERS